MKYCYTTFFAKQRPIFSIYNTQIILLLNETIHLTKIYLSLDFKSVQHLHASFSPHTYHWHLTRIIGISHVSLAPHTYHWQLTRIIGTSYVSLAPHTYH